MEQPRRRRLAARALPGVAALVLAGCSSGSAGVERSHAGMDGDLVIELTEMAYRPDAVEIGAGQVLTVDLVNSGSLRHNLVLPDGSESPTLNAGESAGIEIGPLEDSATAWCSIPGHQHAGMELEIRVTDE